MKKLISLLAVLVISACTNIVGVTEIGAAREPELQTSFNVNKITLSSIYKRLPSEPYIDHMMNVTPDKMTREWLKSRFNSGNTNSTETLEVFIKEASVTQKPVIRYGKTDTEYTVYRANVEIEIKVLRGNQVVGAVFSKAFEERVAENYLSLPEKNKIWEDIVYTALEKADAELETGIHRYLSEYVTY